MSNEGGYVPEIDYKLRDFKPYKSSTWDLCDHCEEYYANLYKLGKTKTPFPPSCEKHIINRQHALDPADFTDQEEFSNAQILLDPILWAKAEFDWEPRWYQDHMLSCSSRMKVLRAGRRIGKTEVLVIETLYELFTKANCKVIMIAPYERQVTRFFDEVDKFIKKSATLKSSVHRFIKAPSTLELVNGSKLLGFSSAASGSSRSDKVRGQDAHLIIIDEIDYLLDSDIEAILAILASRADCRLICASTPQGWRKKFYNLCTDKELGVKEFWFISMEAPTWTDETGKFLENQAGGRTSAGFIHEYLADFAESEEGVFKAFHINQALEAYNPDLCYPLEGYTYIFGVDWNKSAGTHITILEWGDLGKLKLVKKLIIPESEYTQTIAVQTIINLNLVWRPKYIFVDAGYGATQVELLKKHGMKNRSTGLEYKVIAIAMNQHLEIRDPTTGALVIKPAKPYLVQQTAKILEDAKLVLPTREDTNIADEKAILGLVQQMRNYRVVSYSVLGLPRYSQGQDHTLTALILACGGFVYKEGELAKIAYATRIGGVHVTHNPLNVDPNLPAGVKEILEEQSKGGMVLNNTTNPNKYAMPKPIYTRDINAGKSIFKKNIRHSQESRRNIERSNSRDLGGFNRKNV